MLSDLAMKKYAISFAIVYFGIAGACLLARYLVQSRLLVVLLYIAFILLPDPMGDCHDVGRKSA